MPAGVFPPQFMNPQYMAAAQAAAAAAIPGGRGGPGRAGPMPGMPMMPGMPGGIPSNVPSLRGNSGGRGGYGPGPRGGHPGAQGGRGAGQPQSGSEAPPASGLDVNALNSVPPQNQKQMLGEALYPKIAVMQPQLAGKITGMLLEMDNAELLNLTNDDDALKAKVDEAMNVYDEYMKNKGDAPGESPEGAKDGGKKEGEDKA